MRYNVHIIRGIAVRSAMKFPVLFMVIHDGSIRNGPSPYSHDCSFYTNVEGFIYLAHGVLS